MMAGYPTAPLREVCSSIEYGYTASSTQDSSVGPRFLRITDIVPDRLDWESVPFCAIEPKKLAKHRLRTGDIVIARTGATTGWAKYINNPPDAVFASYLVRVRPAASVDARYIGFVVESTGYKDFIQQHMGGAAQPNANAQVLTSFRVPLPPLPIQRRIAEILSAYDDLIANSQRRIKILESMARALYREWFVHFRFPGDEHHRRVPSPLGEIPEGWEVKKLKDVCRLTMGQSPKSEYYNQVGDGVAFHQGVTDFGDRFPTDRLFCTADGRAAQAGDILFSVRAPVGRMNIAYKKIILGRGLSAIRHGDGHQAFLWEQLRNRFTRDDMMGNGAIFASVTKDDMQGIELIAPARSVVDEATKHFEPLHEATATLSHQIESLRRTRDLLMPRLLSGQVDVAALAS